MAEAWDSTKYFHKIVLMVWNKVNVSQCREMLKWRCDLCSGDSLVCILSLSEAVSDYKQQGSSVE